VLQLRKGNYEIEHQDSHIIKLPQASNYFLLTPALAGGKKVKNETGILHIRFYSNFGN